MIIINFAVSALVIRVTFKEPSYSVSESDTQIQPTLVLSSPSSTEITLKVNTSDMTTTGMCSLEVL